MGSEPAVAEVGRDDARRGRFASARRDEDAQELA